MKINIYRTCISLTLLEIYPFVNARFSISRLKNEVYILYIIHSLCSFFCARLVCSHKKTVFWETKREATAEASAKSRSSKTQTNAAMYTVSRKRKAEVQVGCPFRERRDIGTQCSESKGSYGRKDDTKILTYDELKDKYLWDKDYTLS